LDQIIEQGEQKLERPLKAFITY
jgi:hypothetical protein